MLKCCLQYSIALLVLFTSISSKAQTKQKSKVNRPAIIAYYLGNNTLIDSFAIEKLTHIIFSFCHLDGNNLSVRNARDTATIEKLVSLKSRNPELKVILSLGGWGGCQYCSPVFSTDTGRTDFASSVKQLTDYFKTDGLDLDWEYPAIEGYPDHAYSPDDKQNFTTLLKTLRDTLGNNFELSFAAGGFETYLKASIDWDKVVPLVDKINLMSYDLVSGNSIVTGHHTPLYSSAGQKESVDHAIQYLEAIHVPLNKIIIGAAFYAREWDSVATINNGLYQAGRFYKFIPFRQFPTYLNSDSGYVYYRDKKTKASYTYNSALKRYATFDDELSIRDKAKYVLKKKLGGIMFWELTLDKQEDGLLEVIYRTMRK